MLDEIKDLINPENVIVSVALGITIPYIQSKLKTDRIIRVMLNNPALIGEGISVYYPCECFTGRDIDTFREIIFCLQGD